MTANTIRRSKRTLVVFKYRIRGICTRDDDNNDISRQSYHAYYGARVERNTKNIGACTTHNNTAGTTTNARVVVSSK